MQEFVLFLITFLFVLLIYEIFIVRRTKKKKKKKEEYEPVEVSYLVKKYKLDLKKVNYNRLLQVISFTSSLDIALIVSIILFIKNFILEILIGFICTLFIILVSYHIVYLIYKKKGMIKNES